MKKPMTAILVVAFTGGCTPDVTLHITRGHSSPIVGARVERYSPPNIGEKIVNPVGSFYHDTLAEAHVTDSSGDVTIAPLGKGGYYLIYAGTNQTINAQWGDQSFTLTADPTDPSIEWKYHVEFSSEPKSIVTNWVYSVSRAKDGKIIGSRGSQTWKYPLTNQTGKSPNKSRLPTGHKLSNRISITSHSRP